MHSVTSRKHAVFYIVMIQCQGKDKLQLPKFNERILADMRNIIGLISLLVILLTIVSSAITCNSSPLSTPGESDIQAYADPATETTLQGLSENDLAKYTQNANSEFKAAVALEILDKAANQINSQFGNYVSKEFLRLEKQDDYIIVHYKAQYAKGEMGIRMVFDKDHLVAGQWFE